MGNKLTTDRGVGKWKVRKKITGGETKINLRSLEESLLRTLAVKKLESTTIVKKDTWYL